MIPIDTYHVIDQPFKLELYDMIHIKKIILVALYFSFDTSCRHSDVISNLIGQWAQALSKKDMPFNVPEIAYIPGLILPYINICLYWEINRSHFMHMAESKKTPSKEFYMQQMSTPDFSWLYEDIVIPQQTNMIIKILASNFALGLLGHGLSIHGIYRNAGMNCSVLSSLIASGICLKMLETENRRGRSIEKMKVDYDNLSYKEALSRKLNDELVDKINAPFGTAQLGFSGNTLKNWWFFQGPNTMLPPRTSSLQLFSSRDALNLINEQRKKDCQNHLPQEVVDLIADMNRPYLKYVPKDMTPEERSHIGELPESFYVQYPRIKN